LRNQRGANSQNPGKSQRTQSSREAASVNAAREAASADDPGRDAAPPVATEAPSGPKAGGEAITDLARSRQFSELDSAAANGDRARLAQALSSPDPAVQARAFDLLVAQDPTAAGQAALTAVRQAPTPASRLQALQFLEGSRVAQADFVNALSTAAEDPDPEVRNFAILTLGRHGGDQGLSVLADLLHDPDPAVRLLVLQSAAQTISGRVVVAQAADDTDPAVRNLAASLLERMGGQQ